MAFLSIESVPLELLVGAVTPLHLRVTLVTEIRFHLELFRGCMWKGDAIQDLALIRLFAGVGGHNIHIQTFPGFEMHEMHEMQKKKGSGGNTLHKAHFECSNT